MTTHKVSNWGLRAVTIAVLVMISSTVYAEAASKVFLNGIPAPVHFNDGDSFRVMGGKYANTRARLSGFNTLESYGPVHQWGKWTYQELYHNAKMATLNARKGVWHCESDGETDTYGRILWWCEDLAVDQVRKGLAHAMAVGDAVAHPAVIAAQQEAIANRRGMWAHGVPDYVLTSLHATSEDATGHGTYNRLVSTKDGHSLKWRHENDYSECTIVCDAGVDEPERVQAAVDRLKNTPELVEVVARYNGKKELWTIVNLLVQKASIDSHLKQASDGPILRAAVDQLIAEKVVGRDMTNGPKACVLYADFKRRYGTNRAPCLRK